jgi:hypothetical protein
VAGFGADGNGHSFIVAEKFLATFGAWKTFWAASGMISK